VPDTSRTFELFDTTQGDELVAPARAASPAAMPRIAPAMKLKAAGVKRRGKKAGAIVMSKRWLGPQL